MSAPQDAALLRNLRQTLNVTVDGLSDAFDLVQDLDRMTEPDAKDGLPLAAFKARIRTRINRYSDGQDGMLRTLLATLQTAQTMNGGHPGSPDGKDGHDGEPA